MDKIPTSGPTNTPQPTGAEPSSIPQVTAVSATAKRGKPPRKVASISTKPLIQPATLQEVIDLLVKDPDLTPIQRRDRISAITRACAFADTIPAVVKATPQVVTKLLQPLNAAYCRIEHSTFLNMRSLLGDAVNRYCGAGRDNRPSEYDASPPWANLMATAPEPRRLIALRRGVRFFDQQGWLPSDIDREKFDLFSTYLTDNVIIDAKRHVRNSVTAWNRAVKTVPGWPQNRVKLETPGRRFTLDWAAFPQSFRDDFAAYTKARVSSDDITEDMDQTELKASSANTYLYYVRALASALVLAGIPVEAISRLADLVNPVNAKTAIQFFVVRRGKKRSPQTHAMSLLLLNLAKTWCKADEATITALTNIHRNCVHTQVTLTERNLKKLHMLADPHVRWKLYDLPAVLQKEAERTGSPELAAYQRHPGRHCPRSTPRLATK